MRFIRTVINPLPASWLATIPFWIAGIWAFSAELRFVGESRRQRRLARSQSAQDAGSKEVIYLAGLVAIVGAFWTASTWPASITTPRGLPLYLAGIACLVAGGLLRRHCFAMLGSRFTYTVKASPDQAVVERGAYKYVRHPSYTAGLLLYGGIGLALGSWASLAFSLVPLSLAYGYRIAVEERALVQTIGVPYSAYMRRTRRLIPFVL
jgi:protein-S-isoprenylcysteine O-methyltransferase Ste14